MRTTRSLTYREVVSVQGGFCPGVSVQGGLSLWGASVQDESVRETPRRNKGPETEAPPRRNMGPETETLCEQNDWQTGVKTLPSRNFVWGR